MMTKMRKHDEENSIIIDLKYFVFSPSYFRVFVVVLSYYRLGTFMFSRFRMLRLLKKRDGPNGTVIVNDQIFQYHFI